MAMRLTAFVLFSALSLHAGISHAQPQRFALAGTLKNTDGMPLPGLSVQASFGGRPIATVISRADGSYYLEAETFGGISRVDLRVMSRYCTVKEVTDISINTDTRYLDFWLNNVKTETGNMLECKAEDRPMYVSRQPYVLHWPDGMRYYKPDYFDPVVYHNKVTLDAKVTDRKNRPVSGARVAVKVKDDPDVRWGTTDSGGRVVLYMQFDNGALEGKTTVSADGYRTRTIPFQALYPGGVRNYKLRAQN